MVKDIGHIGYSFRLFYIHHPTDRIAHTTAFVTPVVEHWLEREISQWVYHMKDRSDDPSHHERTPLPRSYIPLPVSYHLRIYIKCFGRKEGNVLFNDTFNTFYLRLYGVGHMVKDNSDSGLHFPINSKGSFLCTIPQPLLHQSWSTGWKEK